MPAARSLQLGPLESDPEQRAEVLVGAEVFEKKQGLLHASLCGKILCANS